MARERDNENINQMLAILNNNEELRDFVRDFNEPGGFMNTNSPMFRNLLNLFYADGRASLDSGIVYLCRHVQQLLKNNY